MIPYLELIKDECRVSDEIEHFIESIPGHVKCTLDGDIGLAAWPITTDKILTEGPAFLHNLGLTVERQDAGFVALHLLNDVQTDGEQAYILYTAKTSFWGEVQTCEISYVRHL
jgi:hypothetical protein